MPVDDVPDSTDWLATPLADFAAVEAGLRCRVCKDFYKTPMITSCSHTFCSLCIRRALSVDGKCPLCRKPEQELRLRSNWTIEETVEAFCRARPAALAFATKPLSFNPASKRDAEERESHSELQLAPERKRLRSSTRLGSSSLTRPVATTPSSQHLSEQAAVDSFISRDGDDEEDYSSCLAALSPSTQRGLVPCPGCQMPMKAWQVFNHLDSCPGPTVRETVPVDRPSASTKIPERLPALNYSMLKEQTLRKKLAEFGISNQGSRALLERRHREWITMWNANCDAANPKKRSELLQDLLVWERTQGGRLTSGRSVAEITTISDKSFDGAAWAAKHEASFKDLILDARKSIPIAEDSRDKQADSASAMLRNPKMSPEESPPSARNTAAGGS